MQWILIGLLVLLGVIIVLLWPVFQIAIGAIAAVVGVFLLVALVVWLIHRSTSGGTIVE